MFTDMEERYKMRVEAARLAFPKMSQIDIDKMLLDVDVWELKRRQNLIDFARRKGYELPYYASSVEGLIKDKG